MFRNENPDFLNILHKQQENHAETMKQFAAMGKTISELKEVFTKFEDKILVLQPFAQTYHAEGYNFNSIYVGDAAVTDAAKLVINYLGVQYTITLAAGENEVNIPDGATYTLTNTSKNPISAVLARYNAPRN